jgi:AmmeMemoRadiSam system protein B/AmmeMemoRadiSam system protein A
MATAEMTAPPEARPVQRLQLTDAQKHLILRTVGELIAATITGRQPSFPDPTLDGLAGEPVAGAFVTLKRGKHLRSCTGGLHDRPIALGQALQDAAVRTALEDMRFPPVSPIELEHLDLEVWLLYNPQPVQVRGEERVNAVVTGGKHGLVIARGQNRGLLLPGVAVEHQWDSRRFLEQACVKAGIHSSLWRDDETAVSTFEGDAFDGRLSAGGVGNGFRRPPLLQQEHLPAYLQFCLGNVAALLSGATPTYYNFNVPDVTVNGAILTIRRAATGDSLPLSQISLRPGIPLQATLYGLAQTAAQTLARQGASIHHLDGLLFGVTILHDPAMHGTVADPDLDGLNPPRRAVLVMERGKAGFVFDPKRQPTDLVADAAQQAHVSHPATAVIFSLEVNSTEPAVTLSTAPRPVRGPAERPAGVAGQFYPEEPAALREQVEEMLAGERTEEPWPAAMVPHAGLIYSGRIAASVLKRIRIPKRVIILGPKHTPLGMEWAVAPHQTWLLPGGSIASDPVLAHKLADAIPGLALDAAAHQREHGIEVELPFLARLAPETRVVGITIGHGDLESCRQFADGLTEVIRGMDEPPLLLISSDMNHFATDAENRRLDEMALKQLDRCDPEGLYETVIENQISMCGVLPAVIVLETLKRLGQLKKAERVGYATTADTTGDMSRVVGYAGMLFGPP